MSGTGNCTLWAPLTNAALGLWLVVSPLCLGLFDPVTAPVPPALGHEIAAARHPQHAWLGISEIAVGLADRWSSRLLGMFAAPAMGAVDHGGGRGLGACSRRSCSGRRARPPIGIDTLIGMLVVAFAVMIPPTPGISRRALAADDDRPLGWSYSPSSFTQRMPIVALAFVGLFVSRYLAAYQMGHIDGLWDPFFGPGGAPVRQRQRGGGDVLGLEGLSRSPMPASARSPMRSTSSPARSATAAAGAPCRGWCCCSAC